MMFGYVVDVPFAAILLLVLGAGVLTGFCWKDVSRSRKIALVAGVAVTFGVFAAGAVAQTTQADSKSQAKAIAGEICVSPFKC